MQIEARTESFSVVMSVTRRRTAVDTGAMYDAARLVLFVVHVHEIFFQRTNLGQAHDHI